MIVVAGRVSVRPEQRQKAVAIALEMARATQAEPGCESYRFYADLEEPNTFFVFEEWRSAEDLASHFQTSHMKVFREQLPALLAGPMSVRQYDVSSVGPA